MITKEELKNGVEKEFSNAQQAMIELYNNTDFVEINKKYGTSLISLSAYMISEMYDKLNYDITDTSIFEICNKLIDTVAKDKNMHPSDVCVLLAKIFTDMLMQINIVIKHNEEKKRGDENEK